MLVTIITFVAALAVLILVHELGHFLAARRFGVRVEEFGFGFPPRIASVKRGHTRYSLNWIPLGGFVKIKGEQGDAAGEPDSFASRRPWQRATILVAGVVMNILLAFVLLSVGFGIGLPGVVDNLPASASVSKEKIQIAEVVADSPASRAGLTIGDAIVRIDGDAVASIETLQQYTDSHRDQSVMLEVVRGKQPLTVELTPKALDESGRGLLGVGLVHTGIIRYPFPLAIGKGIEATASLTGQIVAAIADIFRNLLTTGRPQTDVTGPIGIAVITGQVARLGFIYVLQFVAILSINLAIINILPIPALDGGRLLFLAIEKIRGRAVDEKIEAVVHRIGFIVLILLMLVVTFRDVIRFGDRILGAVKQIVGG